MASAILNPETSARYVRDYFAKCGETALINRVRPCADDCGEAFDVFFRCAGSSFGEDVFTVWVEARGDGSTFLYGEY